MLAVERMNIPVFLDCAARAQKYLKNTGALRTGYAGHAALSYMIHTSDTVLDIHTP